jgi:hypothetical protein
MQHPGWYIHTHATDSVDTVRHTTINFILRVLSHWTLIVINTENAFVHVANMPGSRLEV